MLDCRLFAANHRVTITSHLLGGVYDNLTTLRLNHRVYYLEAFPLLPHLRFLKIKSLLILQSHFDNRTKEPRGRNVTTT